jgi:hypothetical protein
MNPQQELERNFFEVQTAMSGRRYMPIHNALERLRAIVKHSNSPALKAKAAETASQIIRGHTRRAS